MNRLNRILILIVFILVIFLIVITYKYFYWKNAYNTIVNDTFQTISKIEEREKGYNRSTENVKIEIVTDSITSSGITLRITDNNSHPYPWKEYYNLKVKVDNNWNDVDKISNVDFSNDVYTLNENNQIEQTINWSNIYGKLPKGTYMIEKTVYTPLEEIYFSSDEFQIK